MAALVLASGNGQKLGFLQRGTQGRTVSCGSWDSVGVTIVAEQALKGVGLLSSELQLPLSGVVHLWIIFRLG